MKDVEAGKIGKLYVYRLDRFSRSVADFGRLWEILKAHNVEFMSVNESFDTTTPMGRAMLHIIMVFAQLERETTAERVRDNYYRRASLGAWPGGPAPFGFSIGRARGKDGREVPTLVMNDASAVVMRIFQAYAQKGASLGSVAKILNEEEIGGAKRTTWDNVGISRILHNPAYVMADEHRITQAVYNLVSNAVTHTGEDKRVVVEQTVANDRVRISVSDSGEGVPADKLSLIWERYYKLDRVHKRAAAGSGLGLSIVRTIMDLNGGSYGVRSTEGEGSTFWIELPLLHNDDRSGENDYDRA